MSKLELYSQIPVLAEATFLGSLDEDQKRMVEMIKEDEVLNFEYQSYVEFLLHLKHFGDRSKVKSILAILKKEHKSRWHRFKAGVERNKVVIDLMSRAAAFLLFAFLVYYLVDTKVDQSEKQIIALGRKVNQIDKKQQVTAANNAKKIRNTNYSGTAFAISKDGLFVTANHIVNGADSVYIFMGDEEPFRAEVVSSDPEKDIAILDIMEEDFAISDRFPYSIKSQPTRLSSDVYTLSFSKNDRVYNKGYVSSLTGYNGDTTFYQLYLPASEGSSGSPVIDAQNNIIGFVSSKNSHESDVTYAVKMEYVKDLLAQNDSVEYHSIFKNKPKRYRANIQDEISNLENFIVNVRVYKR